MGEWNFDMSAAPRGHTEVRSRKGRDGSDIEYTRHVAPRIIAAAADGVTVTASNWLPDVERWNMFTKEHPPVAWMPWPAHPEAA